MTDKIQTNIYLLKDEVRISKNGKNLVKKTDYDFLKSYLRSKAYKEQPIKETLKSNFRIKVFHKKTPTEVKWKEFIKSVVHDDSDILKENKAKIESFIILFINEKSGRIFASTGGYANATMQEIASVDFGIQILSRIVKVDDKALKSTKERNLTGGIQGEVKFFRNDHNLYENDSFGKVYNELNASLTKQNLIDSFGFKRTDLQGDSICIAKNYFSIKKAISFDELERLVEKCEILLSKKPIVEINSIDKISRRESALIEKLKEEVNKNIFKDYQSAESVFSIEISNRDFEKYFQAHTSIFSFGYKRKEFKIEFEGCVRAIHDVLPKMKEKINDCSFEEFLKILNSGYLETFDENQVTLTSDRFFNHFCAEIIFDSKTYFLMEREWYIIKHSFLEKINKQALEFLSSKIYDGPEMKLWSEGTENEYNNSYLKNKGCFVFDKFTPRNIEACDILRVEGDTVYFYHVKKGFDNSMRDLCSQVMIAGKKVFEDVKSDYEYLQELHDDVKNNNGITSYYRNAKGQFGRVSKSKFIQLLRNKKVVFVLAVLDSAKNERDLVTNLEDFESNIAKFALIELSKYMNGLGANFQIVQLKKSA